MKINSKTKWDIPHQSMIGSVVDNATTATNLPITNSVPAFANIITGILQPNLATIFTLRGLIGLPITGYSAQKKALRSATVAIGGTIMGSAYAYAIANNDDVLANQMKTSISALQKTPYTEFTGLMQNAINIVTPLVTALASYNVTSANVATWQDLVTQLQTNITSPRTAIVFRAMVNKNIQSLLHACMLALYNGSDKVALQFKAANIDFYNSYKQSRKLVEHHMSTQLRFYVVDQYDQPVTLGEVFIVGTDKNTVLDLTGYAFIDHIPFGTHQISLTTTSDTFYYGPYDFKMGHSLTLHVNVIDTAEEKKASSAVIKAEETVVETVQ